MNCLMEIDSPFVPDPLPDIKSKIKKTLKSNKSINLATEPTFKYLDLERYYNYIIHKSIKETGNQIDSLDQLKNSHLLMLEAPKSEMDLDIKNQSFSPKATFPVLKRKIQIESRPVKMIKIYNGYYIC